MPGATTTDTHAARAANVLGMAVYRLGYWPRRAVVAQCLAQPLDHTLFMVFDDAPDTPDVRLWRDLVAGLGGHLQRASRSAAHLTFFDEENPRPDSVRGYARLVGSIAEHLHAAARIDVTDAYLVGPSRFRPLSCGPACCPVDGMARRSIEASDVARHLGAHGAPILQDPASLVDEVLRVGPVPPVEPGRLAAARRLVAGHEFVWLRHWREWIGGHRTELDGVPLLTPGEQAALVAATTGPGMLPDLLLLAVINCEQRTLLGTGGPSPADPQRVGRALSLLVRAAASVNPGPDHADIVASIAWLLWLRGDPLCVHMARRARQEAPRGQRPAFVASLLEAGDPLDWRPRPRSRPAVPAQVRCDASHSSAL